MTVYSKLDISNVEILDTSRCRLRVNGSQPRTIRPQKLREELSSATSGVWDIQLFNEPSLDKARASKSYLVHLLIAHRADLDKVDDLFIHQLGVDNLNHNALERFESRLPADPAVQKYGRALGDYALAVFMKDQFNAGAQLNEHKSFVEKMRSALQTLTHFEGVVPQTVVACIRLCLNDFGGSHPDTGTEIDPAIRFFAQRSEASDGLVLSNDERTIEPIGVPHIVCPIDRVTGGLLVSLNQLCRTTTMSRESLNRLELLATGAIPTTPHDALKARILCIEGYMGRDELSDAKRLLNDLQFNAVFGLWARRRLGGIREQGA